MQGIGLRGAMFLEFQETKSWQNYRRAKQKNFFATI
jgi:hypothetical protein